ncbi:MAG: calcium/sodium antiporter [Candidatus Binatia bacterium]
MIVAALVLVFGLALIVKGGDLFVSASVRIAEMLRMPRVVIGSTLVSLATTSPELVVSIVSGLEGAPGLAVGNAVGSCICNIGLVLGLMASLRHVDVHLPALRTPLVAMFSFGVLLFVLTLDLAISRLQGLFLVLAGTVYFAYDFRLHWRDRKRADVAEARAIEEEKLEGRPWLRTPLGTAAQFALGAVLVVAGSRALVWAAVSLARAIGIPPIVIGLSVVAIGTSLPELVTAVTSSRRNVSDLAVGNVLGANIANLTFILGAAAGIQAVPMSRATQLFNFPALLAGMALVLVAIRSDRRVTRREGAGLLAYYGAYLAALVVLTITVETGSGSG